MKSTKYESPKFSFQELKLLERVADTCFGNGVIWLDLDGNGKGGANEPQIPIGGCGGQDAANQLNQWLRDNGYPERANYGPNVCNTQAEGFSMIQS